MSAISYSLQTNAMLLDPKLTEAIKTTGDSLRQAIKEIPTTVTVRHAIAFPGKQTLFTSLGFIRMTRKPHGFLSLGMNGHPLREQSKR